VDFQIDAAIVFKNWHFRKTRSQKLQVYFLFLTKKIETKQRLDGRIWGAGLIESWLMYDGKYVLVPMEPRRDNNLKEAPTRATSDDIREHPVWVRLRDAIMRALIPFAEARAAVVLALDEAIPAASP
jgi:hypothetical protein